ncbi:LexA family transcriptional regulator [Commensalibacter oyaizuii]|uniref:LexA family transcriptional regulator n=1 Tax=Commensalibacter oyaizuii TaxID=3043873 RepID=A0ABT6Q025_9PROT|nr:LexA family transcriptional regulator [Commensalibacter sp. TBRC 16381]MDI2090471.1 LexA family transcriptional regulator [Commensalibacter sp. TBRC 16381]
MKNQVLLDKIHNILKEKQVKPSRAGINAGLGPDFIRKLKNAKNSPKAENLFKLAKALNIDVNYFLDPIDQSVQKELQNQPVHNENDEDTEIYAIPTETIYVRGELNAKQWKKNKDWPPSRYIPLTIPKDSRFLSTSRYGLIIKDDSMNLLYPTGSIVIVTPFQELERLPENGDCVVVTKHDSLYSHYEMTLKIVQIRENGQFFLWPKSDNPEFLQPIILPKPTLKHYSNTLIGNLDDPPTIEIQALVTGCYNIVEKISF